ncbi:MAG: type VI secretion system tip protein VgrG, partial [Vannielia sp.]|nr:type VI secretion system tip protein VgrG [Vannielia sp.]
VIPRIGMEVVVEFLEGDPDKPLVTGCVYNGKNDVPWELPKHKTRSTFRTDTHQGRGFNELYFEDEQGEEKIYLHAQKDHEVHVEYNRTKRVDNNEVNSIGNHSYLEVSKNRTQMIGGNDVRFVGGGEFQALAGRKIKAFSDALGRMADDLGVPALLDPASGNMMTTVAKSRYDYVNMAAAEQIGQASSLTVGTDYQVSTGANYHLSVGNSHHETVAQNRMFHVGETFEVRVGKSRLRLKSDGTILVEGVKLSFEGEEIEMSGSKSVKIKGGRIDLN